MKRVSLIIVLVLAVLFAVSAVAVAGGSQAPADPVIADLERVIPGGGDGGTWDSVQ